MRNAPLRTYAAILLTLLGCAGCALDGEYSSVGRKEKGLVMILPGIGGKSPISRDIGRGLNAAGVQCAIQVREWGFAVPLLKLPVNQMNVAGNRAEAERIAREVLSYQQRYPERPVYLVGFSGGGGMAVFVLEALANHPDSRLVQGVVLLSVSLSNDYDLTQALSETRHGIVSFYNRRDVVLLAAATTLLGNVDGGRAPSAGRSGFARPERIVRNSMPGPYDRLYEVEVTPEMVEHPRTPHVAATALPFVATYVAEWVIAEEWPPVSPRITGTAEDVR